MDMGVWCWCSMMRFPWICTSPENSGCGVLLRVRYMRVSSTNSDGECTFILFADAMKVNFQGFDDSDEDC